MSIAAKEEDLSGWFRKEVECRELRGKIYEMSYDARRWLVCGVAIIATEGATWALATAGDEVFGREVVRDPLAQLNPSAPVPLDFSDSTLLDPLIEACPDMANYAVPMGGNAVYLALGLYLLVVGAFGADLEWFGSGPLDPVVAKKRGVLVAIVMPCKGPSDDEVERGLEAARKLREARGAK